ncbi:hypothetical protein MUG91_G42n36 [Manis pentadactyla]|nr:hypothetical protein MUG91_G42n36 [Manis pentadactyla]
MSHSHKAKEKGYTYKVIEKEKTDSKYLDNNKERVYALLLPLGDLPGLSQHSQHPCTGNRPAPTRAPCLPPLALPSTVRAAGLWLCAPRPALTAAAWHPHSFHVSFLPTPCVHPLASSAPELSLCALGETSCRKMQEVLLQLLQCSSASSAGRGARAGGGADSSPPVSRTPQLRASGFLGQRACLWASSTPPQLREV